MAFLLRYGRRIRLLPIHTYGGVILLGVEEEKDGSFVTSGLRNSDKLIKDFWNIINNVNKVSVNLLTDNSITTYTETNGDEIIAIEVPRAERSERPVYINDNPMKGTFRRNHEGDYHCTKREINAMIRDNSEKTMDTKIIDDLLWTDLNQESIQSYRRRHMIISPKHLWEKLPDDQYLVMIGAAARTESGVRPTAAGLLMFGDDYHIVREFPEYFLDYRQYDFTSEIDWIDRVYSSMGTWSGNLYDFFWRVLSKLYEGLKTPFQLTMMNGALLRSDETPVHTAIREALVNCIINADFFIPAGLVIIRKPESITFTNPGDIRVGKNEMLAGGVTDARNKNIMKMFNLLGIGERAGSGVPRILSVWEDNRLGTPVVTEDYKFIRTSLMLPLSSDDMQKAKTSGKTSGKKRLTTKNYASREDRFRMIIDYLSENGDSQTSDIARSIGLSPQRTRNLLNIMCSERLITSYGTDKTKRYHVDK